MQTDKLLFEEEDLRTTLAAILHRNAPKWMRISTAILKNKEDAEDVLNEAVQRMLKRGGPFSSREHMRMYMGRVVSNTALELYKRRKREKRRRARVMENVMVKSAADSAESFRPDFIMEEEARYAEHEDRLKMLRRGLEELPVHQYEAIRLTVLGNSGMALRDVEAISGIPRTTLRYRYQQGVRALRKYVARERTREHATVSKCGRRPPKMSAAG
jgi:RNA polymerase sigma-70 factor (ECF subfamily)